MDSDKKEEITNDFFFYYITSFLFLCPKWGSLQKLVFF